MQLNKVSQISETRALVLVGGMGTRLRSVLSSTPKPMAPVGKGSFLELLLLQLRSQGVRHVILCTGYLGDQVEQTLGDGRSYGVSIEYSRESEPLGTAGALKLAQPFLKNAQSFLVMNGDSFVDANLGQLLQYHGQHGGSVTIVVRHVENASRYGTVQLDNNDRVVQFAEKTGQQVPGWINAGVYVFNSEVLQQIPGGKCSLEEAIFPAVLTQGIYCKRESGLFIDIGTPEDYYKAQAIYDQLAEAAQRPI